MAKTRSKSTPAKPAKKKTTKKKTVAKKAPAKKSTSKKKPTKKTIKKAPAKKAASKKTTKKKAAVKKPSTKKKTAKKPAAKKAGKKKAASSKRTAVAKPKPAAPVKPEDMTIEQLMELDWTPSKLRRIKSGLSRKEMAEYRAMLIEKRTDIVGDVRGMESARSASLDDLAHMPLHMADIGTDTFEQEFTLGLIESERRLLTEINDALRRMEEKVYGVCLATGRPIGKARLEFKPWAKYCIEVARLREKRGL